MQNNWQIYALGSAFFAGLTAILAKLGVAGISSNVATFIRTLIVCVFLGLWIAARAEWVNPFMLNSKNLTLLILSGLATGLSWLLYFRALQLGDASLVISIDKLSLPFTVILAVFFLGEQLGIRQWLGVALMVMGSLLVAFK